MGEPGSSARDQAPRSPLREAPPAFVTIAVIVANVAVLGIQVATGVDPFGPTGEQSIAWGSNYGAYTLNGQWWRLITSCFVHGGLIHLGFNMYVLWDLGRLTERVFGSLSFGLMYLVAGIGGSLTSTVWNPDGNSVGASGAVFGVAGAFLGFLLVNHGRIHPDIARNLRRSLLTFVLLNVAIGMAIPFIDQSAHLGGLATGFVCALIAAPRVGPQGPVRHHGRLPLVAILGIAMCAATATGLTLRLVAG